MNGQLQPGASDATVLSNERRDGLSSRSIHKSYFRGMVTQKTTTTQCSDESWLGCARCGESIPYESCKNCGYYAEYDKYGRGSADPCPQCHLPHHNHRWTCAKCGCDNPFRLYHYVTTTVRKDPAPIAPLLAGTIFQAVVAIWALRASATTTGSFTHAVTVFIGFACSAMALYGVLLLVWRFAKWS
jgi:hypothetical protein